MTSSGSGRAPNSLPRSRQAPRPTPPTMTPTKSPPTHLPPTGGPPTTHVQTAYPSAFSQKGPCPGPPDRTIMPGRSLQAHLHAPKREPSPGRTDHMTAHPALAAARRSTNHRSRRTTAILLRASTSAAPEGRAGVVPVTAPGPSTARRCAPLAAEARSLLKTTPHTRLRPRASIPRHGRPRGCVCPFSAATFKTRSAVFGTSGSLLALSLLVVRNPASSPHAGVLEIDNEQAPRASCASPVFVRRRVLSTIGRLSASCAS